MPNDRVNRTRGLPGIERDVRFILKHRGPEAAHQCLEHLRELLESERDRLLPASYERLRAVLDQLDERVAEEMDRRPVGREWRMAAIGLALATALLAVIGMRAFLPLVVEWVHRCHG